MKYLGAWPGFIYNLELAVSTNLQLFSIQRFKFYSKSVFCQLI